MIGQDEPWPDLAAVVVPLVGSLRVTGDPWAPYRVVDASGEVIQPIAAYLDDLQAAGRAASTQRSYALDLLRWFRFCWAIEAPWDQATRGEARDFSRWLQVTDKPVRARSGSASGSVSCPRRTWDTERVDRQAVTRSQVRRGHRGAQRERPAALLRLPPRGRDGPDGQPVPVGARSPRPGWERSSQPDGCSRQSAVGVVPTAVGPADPAQHPRCDVQRVVRSAAVAAGPGVGRVLGVHRGSGVRISSVPVRRTPTRASS